MKSLLFVIVPICMSAQNREIFLSDMQTDGTVYISRTTIEGSITLSGTQVGIFAAGNSFHCLDRQEMSNECHVPQYYIGMEWFISKERIVWERLNCCPGMFCYRKECVLFPNIEPLPMKPLPFKISRHRGFSGA